MQTRKSNRKNQRLANWRVTEAPPRTDLAFAAAHGIPIHLPGHHAGDYPQRRKLAKCVGF